MESFNLEYYRAFCTVAQTGNVTKAAEAAVPVPARRNPLHPPAGGVSWLQVVYPRFPRRAAHRGMGGDLCDYPQVLLFAPSHIARKGECEGETFAGFPTRVQSPARRRPILRSKIAAPKKTTTQCGGDLGKH